jgi:hypothetical protein
MNNPLRKEREEITTADIAGGSSRPTDSEIAEGRPKLIQSERNEFDAGRSATAGGTAQMPGAATATPLFPENELGDLRTEWSRIQAGFVDEPRQAVEQADGLVASTMKRLAEVFAKERANLEQQWDHGDNVSTEDLRLALQRYRSFFQRLLTI